MTEFGATEVSSSISRLLRMGEITEARALEATSAFDGFRRHSTTTAETTSADFKSAHALVRRFELKLRAPDALHLAVARRLGLTLVTLDRGLAAAARVLGAVVETPA